MEEEDENGEGSIVEICVEAGDLDRDVNVYVTTSSQTAIGETDSHRVEIFHSSLSPLQLVKTILMSLLSLEC